MKNNKIFRNSVIICISFCISFFILNILFLFLDNLPVHFDNKENTTDYIWEKNKLYIHTNEGFSFGYTNNDGFHNYYDYNNDDDIDILVVGSSQMEAGNVQQNESTAFQLLKKTNLKTYNIGTSGHNLLVCSTHLKNAIKKYNPKKFVIIETSSVKFKKEDVEKVLYNTYPRIPSYNGGIVGFLQKFPFLRRVYHQYAASSKNKNNKENIVKQTNDIDIESIDLLLNKIKKDSCGKNIIIFYHPSIKLSKDGKLNILKNNNDVKIFDKYCNKYNIIFIDMSDAFLQAYKEKYILPYGFINTSIGTGHMNKYGHDIVSNELTKIIKDF